MTYGHFAGRVASRPLAGDGSVPELYGDAPIAVSYGGGVDSTAILGKLHKHGIMPRYIMFADPGDEFDETYAYFPVISEWLRKMGMPEITTVRYQPKRFKYRPYSTLWQNCVVNKTLPSLAFGRKGCSLKWKGAVMDAHVSKQEWAKECFAKGLQVQRLIGYDCGTKDLKRFVNAKKREEEGKGDPRYHYVYPLQAWHMDRDACVRFIETEMDIPVPHKSSCFYCPSLKAEELRALPVGRLEQIVLMEAIAAPNLIVIKGLWRNKRMTDFIRAEKLLSEERLQVLTSQPEQELKKYYEV